MVLRDLGREDLLLGGAIVGFEAVGHVVMIPAVKPQGRLVDFFVMSCVADRTFEFERVFRFSEHVPGSVSGLRPEAID